MQLSPAGQKNDAERALKMTKGYREKEGETKVNQASMTSSEEKEFA